MKKNIVKIPQGTFRISIDELRKQLKGGNVNVGKEGVTMSKAGAIKVPEGTFHISIEELRKQLKSGNVNVGKEGVTMSKAGAIKVPEGTFHSNGMLDSVGGFFGIGEDVITRAKAKLAVKRASNTLASGNSYASESFGVVESEPKNAGNGGQWYENDAERFDLEVKEMESRGFRLIDLYDGRIGFEKIADASSVKITVVCDWQYPLKPPSVFVEGAAAAVNFKKNSDGSLALFTKYMPWKPDMAVCTVIEYFEEKLELMKELKTEASEPGKEILNAPSDRQ